MIGTLGGIAVAIAYFGAAWDARLDEENWFNNSLIGVFAGIAVLTIVGIFLFPRTIGFLFTPSVFIAPVCFLVGWFRHGISHGATMILFGFLMWVSTQIVAHTNPSAT